MMQYGTGDEDVTSTPEVEYILQNNSQLEDNEERKSRNSTYNNSIHAIESTRSFQRRKTMIDVVGNEYY